MLAYLCAQAFVVFFFFMAHVWYPQVPASAVLEFQGGHDQVKFFDYFKQDEKLFDEASRVEGMMVSDDRGSLGLWCNCSVQVGKTLLSGITLCSVCSSLTFIFAFFNCPAPIIRHMFYGSSCL